MTPREKITFLKRSLSVPEYFRITNHHLARAGRQFVILCPFHQEKTPSCFLYEDHYHCFGCNEHGDVIDAHQKLNDVDFQTALDELGHMAGIPHHLKPKTPGNGLRIKITRKETE